MDESDRWTNQTDGRIRQMDEPDRWTNQTDGRTRQMDEPNKYGRTNQIGERTDEPDVPHVAANKMF